LPFIAPELDLTLEYGRNDAEKMHSLIKKISHSSFTIPKIETKISDYSIDVRKEKFKTIAGPEVKKILMVSDFINKIG